MASDAKHLECVRMAEPTSTYTPCFPSTNTEDSQKSNEVHSINSAIDNQNYDGGIPGSDRSDSKFNGNIVKKPLAAKTQSNSRSEHLRGSGGRRPGTAGLTNKRVVKGQQMNPSEETPQKRHNRGSVSSHEANTPEVNMMRSYLIRLPRAMPRQLRWVMGDDLWSVIHSRQTRSRGPESLPRILRNHPALKPQMRAILLDWIIEVCEVYNQLRDTYYLAMDLFDRYLLTTENLPKEQLQLVGVSCLFIAGKMEEIYPPQINEYSYVSDGACEDRQIIAKELAILTALKWDICPMTSNNWLTLFLQLSQLNSPMNGNVAVSDVDSSTNDLLSSNICSQDFTACAQLLDLCTLCMDSICFSPLHLAASVIAHMFSSDEMEKVSGLNQNTIEQCYRWMQPFVLTLREQSPLRPAASADFNKQVHNVNLVLLERAQSKRAPTEYEPQVLHSNSSTNAATHNNAASIATPLKTPTSTRKRSFHDDMTPPSTSKHMRLNDENRR